MVELPESMENLVYWTNRKLPNGGHAKAWVYRKECPQCQKALMGKPVKDNGKVKVRAKIYECPECGHTVPKKKYEESLTVEILYKCPHCGHEGEAETDYKRRSYYGVKAIVFKCDDCNERIGITKKMKKPKKKK